MKILLSYCQDQVNTDKKQDEKHESGLKSANNWVNYWEIILLEIGDLTYIDPNDYEKIRGQEFDLFIGSYQNFCQIISVASIKKSIYFAVDMHPTEKTRIVQEFVNREELSSEVFCLHELRDMHEQLHAIESANYILSLGNIQTVNSYLKYGVPLRKIKAVNSGVLDKYTSAVNQHLHPRKEYAYIAPEIGVSKGFDILFNLLVSSELKSINFSINIIGMPSNDYYSNLLNYLQKSLGEKLTYHGWLPNHHEKYRNIIANSDFILCPSLEEGQSPIVIDAISCGCVPIVSRNTGIDFSPLGYMEIAINSNVNLEIFKKSLNFNDTEINKFKQKTREYYDEQHNSFLNHLKSSVKECLLGQLYPKVSVTLSVYNKEKTIMEVINYLDIALKEYRNTELHIIFDGCEDDSEKLVKDFYCEATLYEVTFEVTPNIFEVKSNNIGLRKSTGEYCVIIQDDNYVYDKMFLFEAVSFLERNSNAVILGRLGGTNFYPCGTTGLTGLGEISYTESEVYWRQDAQAEPSLSNRVFQVDAVMRGPLFLRKSFLESYGYLDEAYAPLYNDDMDICFRARHYGFSVYYMPMDVGNKSLTLLSYSPEKWNWFESIRQKNREIFYSRWTPSTDKDYLWVYRTEIDISSSLFTNESQLLPSAFKVSAIVSTYNSADFMRDCLHDLVEQTLYKKGELEIIVIDSASEQKEKAIVQEFQAKYPNIIYHTTPNRETLYAAWNRGIKMSSGTYITNANTDDRHRPDALEVMANYLDRHSETSLVYADQLITALANDTWATTQAKQRWNWPTCNYSDLEQRCIIGSQPMWRKSLHETYGYFRPEFTSAGDYEFWLRIGKTENIFRLPEILGLYYDNHQGLEHTSPTAHQETHRILNEYGIPQRGVTPATSVPVPISPSELNALPYRIIAPHRTTAQPLASVIIPTKSRPEMLVEAVQSVLNQTYPNVEIVVVNDGGTEVQQVLNPLNTKGNIVYLSHPQTLDRSAARNTGIRAARGKYIAYLDDDDIYYPNHIETLVKFIENSEYKIAYTDAVMAQQEKQNGEYVTVQRSVPYSLDFDNDKILVSNCTPNLCLIHEKSCLDEVGLFDESLSTHEDWDLIIRLSRKFNIVHIKETTCEFTQRNDGTNTSSHNRADFTRTREIIFNQYRQYAEANSAILEAQKEAFIAEAKELAQQVQQIQSQVIQKESQLQETQSEKSQLAAQVETWQRLTQEVQAKLEATQSEKEWVKSQLNSWKQTAEEMQIELDRSRSKLKQAQSQLERSAFPIGKS